MFLHVLVSFNCLESQAHVGCVCFARLWRPQTSALRVRWLCRVREVEGVQDLHLALSHELGTGAYYLPTFVSKISFNLVQGYGAFGCSISWSKTNICLSHNWAEAHNNLRVCCMFHLGPKPTSPHVGCVCI